MHKQLPSLVDAFLNYFDVDLADSPAQRERVDRLRYQVYCREFGWLEADAHPDRMENDEFDSHSFHCLITHRRSGQAAGCVRVIHASDQHVLPLEAHCHESVYLDYLETLAQDRETVCEFSRLAVDPSFRKRPGEDGSQLVDYSAMGCCRMEQRSFSLIGLALLMSACAVARITRRDQIFAMMQPAMPRMLRRVGVRLEEAGNPIDYHGSRSLFFVTADSVEANMQNDLRKLYDDVYARLADSYVRQRDVA